MLHHVVAQLIFMSKRSRRDIHTEASILTTRVKRPDVNDQGKLKRMLKYLKGTKYIKLKLRVESMVVVRW